MAVSKRTEQLVQYVAAGCRPSFKLELGHWIEESSRFRDFLGVNQDKVRKKLGTSDEEMRQDVRAELLVAHRLVADRRFEVAFEHYGAGNRGPDLTVAFRVNQRFNVEITRLRGAETPDAGKIANVICGKLRQLPSDLPNVLAIVSTGGPLQEEAIEPVARLLKTHADERDDAFFARRGFTTARDFYAAYLRLGGVLAVSEAAANVWLNREARRPLPTEAAAALLRQLGG